MGWTVLYIAFGIVALWLLGEVLLQYKARLRWRLLAFGGFLGVVVGVLVASVPVIVLGAIAFATGQTYVTLSFRRGFSTGWAIGGSPGESRRRRGSGGPATQEPVLEVSGLEYEGGSPDPGPQGPQDAGPHYADASQAPSAVYEPQPMPDDTGQYGVYADPAPAGQQPQYAAYDPYTGYGQQPDQQPYPTQNSYEGQDPYPGQNSYGEGGGYPGQETYQAQGTYTGHYDHGSEQTGYPAYSDPYAGSGTGQYAAYDDANGYDPSYGTDTGRQQPADPYAGQYAADTPPGGVWVPQQRENDQYPPLPPEEPARPAPYGNGYDTGQNEQYRY
ncbi:hypothetical protein [Streptomyces sp. NPDC006289]|uniref:hypothetical protein n=1 Tax=Streptomyces sp. NPDC006289 TaxID=3156744 RepID=UPI0033B35EF5